MGILTWVLAGIIVGLLLSLKMKVRGILLLGHVVVAVLGALVGGFNVAYLYQEPGAMNGIHLIAILAAVVGAALAIALLRLLLPRKTPAL